MAREGLTPKQENFVQGLFSGLSQREAYKAAYNCSKASDKTVDNKAYQMANRDGIKTRLKSLQESVVKENTNINAQWVAEQYAKIAGVDLTKFVTWGQRERPIYTKFGPMVDADGNVVTETVNYVDFIDSGLVDGTMVSEVKLGKDGASIKVHDRLKALDSLAKYLGMFIDKHEITGNMTFDIVPAPQPEGEST